MSWTSTKFSMVTSFPHTYLVDSPPPRPAPPWRAGKELECLVFVPGSKSGVQIKDIPNVTALDGYSDTTNMLYM